MEIRVLMSRLSRLSSTAQYRASSLQLVITRNFSQAAQAPNCNRCFTFLYQCKSPQFSLLNFIQTERFSSNCNRSSSQIVLQQARLSEMMRGMGFREETVKKLFEQLPLAVLKDSAGFRKKLDHLKYFGLSSLEIDQILFTFPEYFQLSLAGRLKLLLDELHEMNFSDADIRAVIHENPKPFLRLEAGELPRRERIVRPCHPVGIWKLFKPQKFPESENDVRNMSSICQNCILLKATTKPSDLPESQIQCAIHILPINPSSQCPTLFSHTC